MADVFLNHFLPWVLRKDLSLNLEPINLSRLTGQWFYRIHLSPLPPPQPQHCLPTTMPSCCVLLEIWTCVASTLPPGPSLWRWVSLALVLLDFSMSVLGCPFAPVMSQVSITHALHTVSVFLPSFSFQYLCHVYSGLTFLIISILRRWHVTVRDFSNSSSELPFSLRALILKKGFAVGVEFSVKLPWRHVVLIRCWPCFA